MVAQSLPLLLLADVRQDFLNASAPGLDCALAAPGLPPPLPPAFRRRGIGLLPRLSNEQRRWMADYLRLELKGQFFRGFVSLSPLCTIENKR